MRCRREAVGFWDWLWFWLEGPTVMCDIVIGVIECYLFDLPWRRGE